MRDIPFLEQAIEAIRGTARPGDHPEPRPEDVARAPERVTDHVGLGDEADAEQLAQRGGIDRIGLDLGVRDGLEELRMGQVQVNPLGDQQRAEPIPAAGGFDDGVMGSGELGKVAPQRRGIIREGRFPHALSRRQEGGHGRAEPMLIDAGEEHRDSKR